MDGWMDGRTKARTVCEWMGWAMAWIRPRLVEFIACNLHNSISVGSSEMLVARKKMVLLGPPGRQQPIWVQCAVQVRENRTGCLSI